MTVIDPPPVTEDSAVHLAHFLDGYPLCWTYDLDGEFTATRVDTEVTCSSCRAIVGIT